MGRNTLKRENVKLELCDIIPYENNAKVHSDEQIELLAREIKEVGYIAPIVLDENNVILAGHGRLEALKILNVDAVECLRITGLTEANKKAYRLADNRIGEVATEWDNELVQLELNELQGLDFNIELTGFELTVETEAELPEISDADKSEFEQMTFTLHAGQAEMIREALAEIGDEASDAYPENPNGNGNKLSYLVSEWQTLKTS